MNKLITESLKQGNVDFVLRFSPAILNTIELRYVEWIAEYFSKYGTPPTLARFKAKFGGFVAMDSKSPLKDIFEQEMVRKKNIFFRQSIMEMEEELVDGADPTELIEKLSKAFRVSSAEIISNKSYDRSSYFRGVNITPTFIPFVDRVAGGIADGDLVYIVGRPGSNKTTMAEQVIVNWMLIGKRILYISNENAPYEVMPKLDAFVAGFDPGVVRIGNWTDEKKLLVKATEYFSGTIDGEIELVRDPVTSSSEVEALIKTEKPDLVLIDGTYLMTDGGKLSGDWRDLTEVSRNLKKIVRRTRTPILGVIQANRSAENKKVERDQIAGTDAYLQDADLIIVSNVIDGQTVGQVIKSRWGLTPFTSNFMISADFNRMYVSTSELGSIDISELEVDEDW